MTAEQLRNSILQEAISGRLVPQDPNDEPASALLARIREEKARLVKEGKLKKKDLVETPIKEEEIPFEIPSSWEWVRLKNIVFILGDGIHGTPEYDIHGAYYFVNGNNLSHNRIILKGDTKRVNEREYLKYRKILNETTILVSINGTIGNVGHYNGEPVILGKSACYYNLMDAALKPYITTLMYTDYFLKYAKGNATGSTIKNVSLAVMNDFIVPLPPSAEQKRIVAKLEELLPIVEQYGKAQKELDELNNALPARLRQSILQEAISGKLVPQNENDGNVDTLLDEVSRIKEQMLLRKEIKQSSLVSIPIEDEEIEYGIPDSWRFVRLQDICTCIFSGKSPKYSQIPTKHKIIGQQSNQWTGVEMKYIKYGTDEYAKDIPQIQYLQDHDVLLNTLGNGTLGRSGIYYSSYSNTPVLTDGHIFVLRTPHEVTAKYILAYLRVKFVDINRSADGSTNQTFLNLTKFAEIDKLK